jgi:predicted PurR-regulated permease PerM
VPDERYARWRTTATVVWAAIGILLLIAVGVWALGKMGHALVPFIMAFVIVFLLNAPVRLLVARGVRRPLATVLCLLVLIATVGVLFAVLGPAVGRQASALAQGAPKLLKQIEVAVNAVESRASAVVLPSWLAPSIEDATLELGKFVVSLGNAVARVALDAAGDIAEGLLYLFLALIIAFWALADLPKIRQEISLLVGPTYKDHVEHLLSTVTRMLGGYLRGQTIASLTTATISTTCLTLLGVPYSLVFGLIHFTFNFAPYVGPLVVGLIAGLLGLLVSPWVSLAAVGCVLFAQNFTDFVVVPRVMSSQVDLHPTLVILALLVGGTVFGIPGLLFAIPVAATGKGLFVYHYERSTDRQLGSADGALFRLGRHGHRPKKPVESDAAPANTPADKTE